MLNDYGKELFKPWCSVQNVALALSVLFLMALAIARFNLNSSEMASWVQAIGSIAAIWGAFTVSNNQVKRQIEQKKEDEKRKSLACYAVVKCAVDHARSVGEVVEKGMPLEVFKISWSQVLSNLIESSLNSLKQLPAHELGNYDLVISLAGITGGLANIFERSRKLNDAAALLNQEHAYFLSEVSLQCKIVEMHWRSFEKASAQ